MDQKILVIGATGMLGKPVAQRLLNDGFKVRVMARDPQRAGDKLGSGFEIIAGDVLNPDTLDQAMDGCDCVHINLSSSTFRELFEIEYTGSLNVLHAALRKQLKRLSIITGAGIKKENTRIKVVKVRFDLEQEIIRSGIPYTIFGPTHFMDSIPMYIKGDKAMIIGKQPHKIHWVAASDYARMVSRAYMNKETENKKFWILGPEPFTMEEAFNKYCKIKCKNILISKVSLATISLMATITFNSQLKYVAHLMKYFNSVPESVDPEETNKLLGKPTTTMDMWLSEG